MFLDMKLWGCMDIYGPKINRRLYFAELPWASACLFISNSSRYLLYQPLVTPSPGLSVEGDKSPQTPPTYPAKMIRMPIKILMLIQSAAAVCYSRCHRILIYSLRREEPFCSQVHTRAFKTAFWKPNFSAHPGRRSELEI